MVQMVLLPRFGMKPDIDYDPESDWEDDVDPDLNVLGYEAFHKALFKVPDLWCDGINANDYVQLLNDLLDDAKKRTALWNRLLKRYVGVETVGIWRSPGLQTTLAAKNLILSTNVAAMNKFKGLLPTGRPKSPSSSGSPQSSTNSRLPSMPEGPSPSASSSRMASTSSCL